MTEWIIYYGDGSSFSSNDGEYLEAPARDVQLIVVADTDAGWRTVVNHDFYVWDRRGDQETWWGADHFGLWDYLTDIDKDICRRVLFGRLIDTPTFQDVFNKALSDKRLPRKTNFVYGEKTP